MNIVYEFNLDKFEELDDIEMWNHELFQNGLHRIDTN